MTGQDTNSAPAAGLRAALQSALEWWDDAGVDAPPVPAAPRARAAKSAAAIAPKKALNIPNAPAKSAPAPKPSSEQITAADADRFNKLIASATAISGASPTLEALYAAITTFDAGDLSVNARQAVIARGNPQAKIMFIGESPGRDEDIAGKPFVGRAGQLLDRMLAAIGLSEDNAYITNICNWRPINGRTPGPQEIELARPFIARHIELAAPQIIVAVGGLSVEVLTGQKGITKLRGQWQDYSVSDAMQTPLMPLYHPAFLLRRPELKAEAWRDLLAIKAKL